MPICSPPHLRCQTLAASKSPGPTPFNPSKGTTSRTVVAPPPTFKTRFFDVSLTPPPPPPPTTPPVASPDTPQRTPTTTVPFIPWSIYGATTSSPTFETTPPSWPTSPFPSPTVNLRHQRKGTWLLEICRRTCLSVGSVALDERPVFSTAGNHTNTHVPHQPTNLRPPTRPTKCAITPPTPRLNRIGVFQAISIMYCFKVWRPTPGITTDTATMWTVGAMNVPLFHARTRPLPVSNFWATAIKIGTNRVPSKPQHWLCVTLCQRDTMILYCILGI